MQTALKPGDVALAVFTQPTLRLVPVRVKRVWISVAGTERCEFEGVDRDGKRARPGASIDRRQLIAIDALENFATSPGESADTKELAKAAAI